MKKILSFVMALAMVTSLMATPKVALLNKSAKKTRTELTLPAVQKHQPQVKHVAKKHVVRKAAIKKAAMETTATFTFASDNDVNQTVSGVTLAIEKAGGQSDPAWNTTSKHLRVYASNTITISGSGITKIELTCGKTKASAAYASLTANTGSLVSGGESTAVGDFKTDTWTGTANEVVFTLGASGQRAVEEIVVTVGGEVPPTPPTPTGDVEIQGLVYADAIYYDGYWDFDFYKDYDYDVYEYTYPEVYFMCNEEAPSETSIVGTYTAMYAGYWKSANDSVEIDDAEPVGTVTVTCVEQGIYNFVGSFVGTDGKTYTWNVQNVEVWAYDGETYEDITLTDGGEPVPPTPSDTIYSTINHPVVMDSIADFGWIYVSGQNEDYSLGIQVNTDHLLGEFTNEDIEMEYTQMIDWAAYDYVDIESIPSVVIAQIADTLRFTVTVKATDGQVYVVTLNDFVAQPTGEEIYVDIVLPDVSDATETEGWFQTMGYDVTGEYYASICVNTNNMFGTFAAADMDWEYTGLYIGETAVQLIENSIAVTVFNVADTVVFRTEVLDVDGTKWIITMKDFTPTPIEVIDLVTVDAMGEYSSEYGDYYASGTTAAGDQIALDIYMDKLASGTFTIDDVESYYSGIELADGTFVEFYSADITLTVSGKDVLIEAVIIGRDVKQYNVTMEISGGQPSGDHTIVIADYEDINFTTFDEAYTVATAKNGGNSDPTYNDASLDLRLYAKNTLTLTSNNGAMTEIVFNISTQGLKRQADITVSAGSITSYDMDNAKVTWTGNATEVTFTVGDKATHGSDGATKAGQFDFTSIDIVNPATGLFDINVNANVNKFMYNGNVMINVNGVIYNVLGAEIKR